MNLKLATPTFSLSDGFQRSYGYFFRDHPFFWSTLYKYTVWLTWYTEESRKCQDINIFLFFCVLIVKILSCQKYFPFVYIPRSCHLSQNITWWLEYDILKSMCPNIEVFSEMVHSELLCFSLLVCLQKFGLLHFFPVPSHICTLSPKAEKRKSYEQYIIHFHQSPEVTS